MLSFKSFLLGESLSYKNDYIIEDSSILKYKNKYNILFIIKINKYNFISNIIYL